jgi:hypothetical protein
MNKETAQKILEHLEKYKIGFVFYNGQIIDKDYCLLILSR